MTHYRRTLTAIYALAYAAALVVVSLDLFVFRPF